MEQLISLVDLSDDLYIYWAIDIGIAIVFLFTARIISGFFDKVSVREELDEKDNLAFGISLAGRLLSLTIVLSALVGRQIGEGYLDAALSMLMFGVMGIVLVKIGRVAHDKLIMNRFDKDEMIQDKNASVALVDASAAVASAIITKSIIEWTQGSDTDAFIAVFSGYIVVLLVLLLATRIYEYNFAENNQNNSFQRTLCRGQIALAVQHGGHLIGIAIAVSAASKLLIYTPQAYVSNVTGWLIAGMALALSLMVINSVTKRVVLAGVEWQSEVSLQHNVGIGAIEAALSIGIALLFTNIFL